MSARRLRVLQVGKFYPPHMGGMETHLQVLCRELQPHHDVEVLVASDTSHDEFDNDQGVKITRAGTLFKAAATSFCKGMIRRIFWAKADLIHLHMPNPSATLAYLASQHPAPMVVTYHSDIIKQKTLGAMFEPVLHKALSKASAIIATSPQYLATSPILQAHKDRCRVLPYGIPVESFSSVDEAKVAEIRRQFGQRTIITVGRLIYYKGFDVLIRAMKEVDGKLLIVGDGPLRGELEALANSLGIAERIVFLGEIQNEDVVPYYHASDIFALASIARSEAFGIVQLEAMACGVPVVNTDLDSGVPFVSLGGRTGLTVPHGDAGAMAAALNSLLDDAGVRARFGQAGRARVNSEFTREVMTRRMLDLYAEITEKSDK
jgi:glycosyltransferase involved in cell wall biosynthesis